MRPNMPPRIGLIFALLLAAVTLVLFSSSFSRNTAQAQDDVQVQDPLVAANIDETTFDSIFDLDIRIINSEPTYVDELIVFTATVNLENLTGIAFSWEFGDTQTANGRVVNQYYNNVGLYTVKLYVTTATEQREVRKAINVIPPPGKIPVLPKGLKLVPIDGDPHELEAQKSLNFLATVAEGTDVRYIWSFNDSNQKLTGSSINRRYEQPGSYTITIEAFNEKGNIIRSFPVTIIDAPPEDLTFSYQPDPIQVGVPIIFTADQSRGTNLVYEWEFFDGRPLKYGKSVPYQFDVPGPHEIHLTAWNKANITRAEKAEYSKTINVEAVPPSSLRLIPSGPVNEDEFLSLLIFARSQVPVTIKIDWGDRDSDVIVLSQSIENPLYQYEISHKYGDPGVYPVVVTISNAFGEITETFVAYVSVEAYPQWPFNLEIPPVIEPLKEVKFRILDEVAPLTCRWIITDQLAARGFKESIYKGKEANHSFRRAGPHVATAECKSADGTIIRVNDFVVIVEYQNFVPAISYYGIWGVDQPRPPLPTTTPVPTDTPVPPTPIDTPVPPTLTSTPVPATSTETPVPPTPTATPTSTFVPTSPALPTPTATTGPGGTIPGG